MRQELIRTAPAPGQIARGAARRVAWQGKAVRRQWSNPDRRQSQELRGIPVYTLIAPASGQGEKAPASVRQFRTGAALPVR